MGFPWEDLHPDVQDYLLRRAQDQEEVQEVKDRLGLEPGTGKVVAIGMWLPGEDRGSVLVEGPSEGWIDGEGASGFPAGSRIFRGTEAEILSEFWSVLERNVGQIITYNGRTFDGPFLMIRSAILGVKPTRNLVPYRFSFKEHCDLAEVLSFFGARRMKTFLFWCRQFGIDSPKDSMSGHQVAEAYRQGDIDGIARYSLEDARATAQLYLKLGSLIEAID